MSEYLRASIPQPPPSQSSPPPAPPLPPPKYANRATTALARFAQPFRYGSRPTSARANRGEDLGRDLTPASVARIPGPLPSQTTTHKTGLEISALDISSHRTHAVLAGQKILKTVRISDATCAEEFNLRSAIITYASTHNTSGNVLSAKHKDQLGAVDVKWSHGMFDSTIATAVANGKIVLYDINKPGVELARLHEHNRQVHKLAFSPIQGALLLSGSQDTTVRLWDLRARPGERGVLTYRSVRRYMGNTESVRDVKWSPNDAVEFAFGTDNGVVQRWDFRKDNAPLLKINAHDKTCNSIDWHPDGKHLASASADKNVKVWDFSTTNRRQKPIWVLRAPHGVMNVRWRPPCRIPESHEPGGLLCTQMATSYEDRVDPRIHIWDLRRPHMPFRELERYNRAPTDMLWHSQDLLWTVGKEGMFTQTDMYFTPKVLDRRSLHAVDWSADGGLSYFTQKRRRRRRSSFDESPERAFTESAGHASSGEGIIGSRDEIVDDGVDESFLSSSSRRSTAPASRAHSTKSLGSTPPSVGASGPVIMLTKALDRKDAAQPGQLSVRGHISGTFDAELFAYLAESYKSTTDALSSPEGAESASMAFDANASIARDAGFYRIAQTWQMLGLAIKKELRSRAQENRKLRVDKAPRSSRNNHHHLALPQRVGRPGSTEEPEKKPQATNPTLNPATRAIAASEGGSRSPVGPESTSNMTTPLAKPRSDTLGSRPGQADLARLDSQDKLMLPPAMTAPKGSALRREERASEGSSSRHARAASSEWFNFQKSLTDQKSAMSSWQTRTKPIFNLDTPSMGARSTDRRPPNFDRHISSESFPMFSASASTDSQATHSMDGSQAERANSQESGPRPERWNDKYVPLGSLHQSSVFGSHAAIVNMSSSESDNFASYGSSLSDQQRELESSKMEASGTIVPDDQTKASSSSATSGSPVAVETKAPTRPTSPEPKPDGIANNSNMQERPPSVSRWPFMTSDFSPNTNPGPVEPRVPWSASAMLHQAISFHTNTLADAQTLSHLLLLLNPLLSPAESVHPLVVESILGTYHSQLLALQLHKEAAHLRRLCHPTYPSISELGLQDTYVGLLCRQCGKPLENVKTKCSIWVCERCLGQQAPCAVCNLRTAPPPSLIDDNPMTPAQALWGWCQGCGHGGHDSCLRLWWDAETGSEGICPTQGCLHDCIKGQRRDERLRGWEERERRERGPARRDSWVVGESKAVEKARAKLAPSGPIGLAPQNRRVRLVEPKAKSK